MNKTNFWRLVLPIVLALLGLELFLHSALAASQERGILSQDTSAASVITVTTTIQAAIDQAQPGDIIKIMGGTWDESLVINKDITLRGIGKYNTFIWPPANSRAIYATGGHILKLEYLTIKHGNTAGGGGGIYTDGRLDINNCQILYNSANYGGGIYQDRYGGDNGWVKINDSEITDNSSNNQGGGVFVTGDITLTNTSLDYNSTGTHGGGLSVQDGRTTIFAGEVLSNTAGLNGAGINVNNDIWVNGTVIAWNNAGADGGGLLQYNPYKAVKVDNAYFALNRSHGNGGGLWAKGNLNMNYTMVISNTAGPDSGTGSTYIYGGGVYLETGSISVSTSFFRGNTFICHTCSSKGGGLYMDSTQAATIQSSSFEKNYSFLGGGVYYTYTNLVLKNSKFIGNQSELGGGIILAGGNIQDTDFVSNYAAQSGGALSGGSLVQISGSRFINNTVHYNGGGAISGNIRLVAVNTLFAGNHADTGSSVMELSGSATSSLEQVTIASYGARDANEAIHLTNGTLLITNTIITNYLYGVKMNSGTLNVDYDLYFNNQSNVISYGGVFISGLHCLEGDPLFVNPAIGDYHLQVGSPAVNHGKNLGVLTDLDGTPRDAKPDIGAYEFQWYRIYLPAVRR
jgi:predicted outer membrane repeat protein